MNLTATIPADLQLPCIIEHEAVWIGIKQLKRIDSIKECAPYTVHPAVAEKFGIDLTKPVVRLIGDRVTDEPVVRLIGDTVTIDNEPVGAVRGWQVYANADAPLNVVRTLND